MNPIDAVDEVFALFERFGASTYDEQVTLTEHCVQTAALAVDAGANDELIGASLMHDVGHFLLARRRGHEDFISEDWAHDRIAAEWLRPRFGDAIADVVGAHVDAKRWLCHTEPTYFEQLSPASVASLAVQGGPFTSHDALAFEAQPFSEAAVQLRRWDDHGKLAGLVVQPLESFEPILRRLRR